MFQTIMNMWLCYIQRVWLFHDIHLQTCISVLIDFLGPIPEDIFNLEVLVQTLHASSNVQLQHSILLLLSTVGSLFPVCYYVNMYSLKGVDLVKAFVCYIIGWFDTMCMYILLRNYISSMSKAQSLCNFLKVSKFAKLILCMANQFLCSLVV